MPETPKWSKMSKSKGNGIGVDEVVRGIYQVAPGYEFRGLDGQVIDWHLEGVWFQVGQGYRTSMRRGSRSVFLHIVGNPIPAVLTTMETIQHVEEHAFWRNLLGAFDFSESCDILE